MEHSSVICFIVLSIFHSSLLNCESNALPVTSKPIENSVENLAWQAWLMLPSEQKNLEKTRKVTPKSIFTLPLRDCPIGYKKIEIECKNNCAPSQMSQIRCVATCPNGYKEENLQCVLECPSGHKVFNFRCISVFNVDQDNLLAQELGLLAGNIENSYDYEDQEILVYDNSQKFSDDGISMGYSYESETQLPNRDEPLKFNIFEQRFPTDYTEYGIDLTANKEVNHILNKEINTSVVELNEESSVISETQPFNNISDPQFNNVTSSLAQNTLNPVEYFSLGSVDAIKLPASTLHTVPGNVSLFKTENLTHTDSFGLNKSKNYQDFVESNSDLAHLMLIDDLLPVNKTSFESSMWQTPDSELTVNKSFNNVETEKNFTFLETEDSITFTPSLYINQLNFTFDPKLNISESKTRAFFEGTKDMNMYNVNHINTTKSDEAHNLESKLDVEKSKTQETDIPTIEESFNSHMVNISDPEENFGPENANTILISNLLNKTDLNDSQTRRSIGNEIISPNKMDSDFSKPTDNINETINFGHKTTINSPFVEENRTLDSSYVVSASLNNLNASQYESNTSKSLLYDKKRNSSTSYDNSTFLEILSASNTNVSKKINSDANFAESFKFTSPMNFSTASKLRSTSNSELQSKSFLESTETFKPVLYTLNRTEFDKLIQHPVSQSVIKKSDKETQLESKSNGFLSLETDKHNMSETSTNSFEPFWWLPFGWSLDRTSNQSEYPEKNNQNRTSEALVFGLWSKTTRSNNSRITSQNTQKATKSFIDDNAS